MTLLAKFLRWLLRWIESDDSLVPAPPPGPVAPPREPPSPPKPALPLPPVKPRPVPRLARPLPAGLVELVKQFESLHDGDPRTPVLEAKRDPVGFWTVGWGHLVSRDRSALPPPPITPLEAEVLLQGDLARSANAVMRLVRVPLTEGQYAALVDFAFNAGAGALEASSLRMKLNRGEYSAVPAELRRWVYAGGVKLKGLVRRREAEARLWTGL